MSAIAIGIFAEDLMATFEHYKRAFNATLLATANGSQGELIHLEMDIKGNKIWVQPLREVNKSSGATILGLKFHDKKELLRAYDVLKEDCVADDGLKEHPWCTLEGFVTDKFGVTWLIGLAYRNVIPDKTIGVIENNG